LDVGSGTGYLTAAMALITPVDSRVYGIDHVPELIKQSIINISKSNPELMLGRVIIE
jgi:protein-L-isoaspartate(D-aspartate) O-methyltransferase